MRSLFLILLCFQLSAQSANWKDFGPNQRLIASAKLCLDSTQNLYYSANGDTNHLPGKKWALYKIDPQGNVIWNKLYGGVGNYTASQILFNKDKLFVAGDKNWNDTDRAWVMILDTAGNVLQQNFFGSGDSVVLGQDIAINQNSELALLNQVRSQSGQPLGAQVLILDTNLNVLDRHLQLDTAEFVSHEICPLPFGGWVYTADYQQPTRFDILVTKIDARAQFVKRVIVSNGYTRGGNAIAMNDQHQIVIGGEGASAFSVSFDITLTRLDTNLNLISDVFVRPGVVKNDACFDMAISPYGTYLFTGYYIAPENGNTEMIVVESDSLGNRLHIDTYAKSSTCIGSGIICDNQGRFYAAGSDFNLAPSLILASGMAKGLNTRKPKGLENLEFFPQPFQDELFVKGDFRPQEWKLLDALGREYDFHYQEGKIKASLKPGYYFLRSSQSNQVYRLISQ